MEIRQLVVICAGRAVYEGNTRVYSPNNPQPVSFEGYATQSWVLQNFVQNIDLTAPAEVDFVMGGGIHEGQMAQPCITLIWLVVAVTLVILSFVICGNR
jgi:hypothetical protein